MSLTIQESVPLASFTTFHIGGPARFFVPVRSREDIQEAVAFARDKNLPLFVLGGGSNVVMPDEGWDGVVLKNEVQGIEYTAASADIVEVTVGAGVVWDSFVQETVERGLWGIENLSGIPGSVGATPVQNVGAYGRDVAHCIKSVEALHMSTGTIRTFTNDECMFGYRNSFFKSSEGKEYLITKVVFTLSTKAKPELSYKDLARYFADQIASGETILLSSIREAVLAIRAEKFPDITLVGTAGSFFKNPIVPSDVAEKLLQRFPDMPHFEAINGIKLSLAWILDKVCELKGYQSNSIALFEKQPLVLVAYQGATAKDIEQFAKHIADIVYEKTNISIEREVTIVQQ